MLHVCERRVALRGDFPLPGGRGRDPVVCGVEGVIAVGLVTVLEVDDFEKIADDGVAWASEQTQIQ